MSNTNTSAYVPPFSVIKQAFDFKPGRTGLVATVSYDALLGVIQQLLRSVPFNEEWYLATYVDVAEAIKTGATGSAKQHFVECGYFEGRSPAPVAVDEKWYLSTYSDVALAVKSGEFASAAAHFREMGYVEGRLPAPL